MLPRLRKRLAVIFQIDWMEKSTFGLVPPSTAFCGTIIALHCCHSGDTKAREHSEQKCLLSEEFNKRVLGVWLRVCAFLKKKIPQKKKKKNCCRAQQQNISRFFVRNLFQM